MEKEKQPLNVLFIITDQHRKDHLSCYNPNIILKTPNIDSITDGGMKFTNNYCSTPICMPNRASFFTGSYPTVHGTRSNGINLNTEIPTITEVLRQQGYYTATIGKTHFNFYAPSNDPEVSSLEEIPIWLQGKMKSPFPTPYYGFDEVDLAVGHGDTMVGHYLEWLEEKSSEQANLLKNRIPWIFKTHYDSVMPEELYPTSYITNKSVEFLQRYSEGKCGDKPFFLHVSFNDPHHPACPPGKYKDMYNPDDIELPANFKDGEKLLNHEVLGKFIKDNRFPHLLPVNVKEETAKIFTALTYGSIKMIDDGIGNILDTLKQLGLEENTVIIFTSDHGDLCGNHGLILKGPAHYRGIINIPLLMKVPQKTKTSVSDSLINTIDLPKTILKILGIDENNHPETFQGFDYTPLLEDPSKKIRERILIEHDEEISDDTIFRLRTLVTERHRLTIYDGHENIGDLFDLKNDPGEVNNLWYLDEELKNKLIGELLREIIGNRPHLPKRNAYN